MLLKRWREHLKAQERGDTIIEVMIVLAVLGLAIGICYATANRSLLNARQAQENSEAASIVQSQVETMRGMTQFPASDTTKHYIYGTHDTAHPFCIKADGTVADSTTEDPGTTSNTDCKFGTPDSRYLIATTYSPNNASNPAAGTFTVKASWPDVLGRGTDSVTNTYRLHAFDPTNSATTTVCDTSVNPSCSPIIAATCSISGQTPDSNNTCACLGQLSVQGSACGCPTGQNQVGNTCVTTFSWAVNGKDFLTDGGNCTEAEPTSPPVPRDGHNGCNPSADPQLTGAQVNSVFARRAVQIIYRLTGSSKLQGRITDGPATLVINYNQYQGANTAPPANYANFILNVTFDTNGDDSRTYSNIKLPINANPGSPRDFTQSFNVPADATYLELRWTNNVGLDPDLQINSIRLSKN